MAPDPTLNPSSSRFDGRMRFDAFISYSHSTDAPLARALKGALHRFAKPWYRLRALRVFLDDANLSVNSGLWSAIEAALNNAGAFLLLASPAAAQSVWVGRELSHWRRSGRSLERLFIILTEGEIAWDDSKQDFDWRKTTALPDSLAGAFRQVPLWIDLRWARAAQPSLNDPRFLDAVADLAAPLHHVERDAIEGEDLRQHRRTLRVAWSAAVALGVLAGIAGVSAVVASRQRDVAIEAAETARQRLLRLNVANGARLLDEGDTSGALLWFAEATRLAANHPAEQSLVRSRLGTVSRQQPRLKRVWFQKHSVTGLGISKNGDQAVAHLDDDTALILDLRLERDESALVRRQGARVLDVLLARDRSLVLTAEPGSVARVWNAGSGVDVLVAAHEGPVNDGYFTRDGKQVVTAGQDGKVRLWRLSDGRQTQVLELDTPVDFVHGGPRDSRILASSTGRTVRVWDLGARSAVKLSLPELPAIFTLSPDETAVLTVGTDRRALLWSATTGQRLSSLGDWEWVERATFSPDGKQVAMTTGYGWLRLWNVSEGGEGLDVLLDGIGLTVAFSPDGKRLVTGSTGRTARVWEVKSGERVAPILWHDDNVIAAVFTPDGKRLVTAAAGGAIRLWELQPDTGTPLEHGGRESVVSVAFSADGARVLSATDWEARVWPVGSNDGKPGAPVILKPGSQLRHAGFSPDGLLVVTCSENHIARIWDARTGRVLLDLPHERRVQDAVFAADGSWLVTASGSRLQIWNPRTGAHLASLEAPGNSSPVMQLEMPANAERLLARHFSGDLAVWDTRARSEVVALRHRDVDLAAYSTDGKRLAIANNESIQIIDAATGATITRVPRGDYRLSRIAFSADGTRLLTADRGGTARVWSAVSGLPLAPALRHSSQIITATFGPGDVQIATASDDLTVRIWDARTGEPLGPPLRHGEAVINVAFSPDGRRIATASRQHAAYLWDIGPTDRPLDELIGALEAHASRRLDETGSLVPLSGEEVRRRWSAQEGKSVPAPRD